MHHGLKIMRLQVGFSAGAEPALSDEQSQQNLDGTHGWKYN